MSRYTSDKGRERNNVGQRGRGGGGGGDGDDTTTSSQGHEKEASVAPPRAVAVVEAHERLILIK